MDKQFRSSAERVASAERAGLRYSRDTDPGFRRVRKGRGFAYYSPAGELVRQQQLRRRFADMALPPAWRKVWICQDQRGHLQATGFDEKGRKQYRYHPQWVRARHAQRFRRLIVFPRALSSLRRHIDKHLRRHRFDQLHVCALAVSCLDRLYLRVGGERYAEENGSHGLCTLRRRHLQLATRRVVFDFLAKSAKRRYLRLDSSRIAAQLKRLLRHRRDRVFSYVDAAGRHRPLRAVHVNDYLAKFGHHGMRAKDFRSWGATHLTVAALLKTPARKAQEGDVALREALDMAAERLGNTSGVCRAHYVDPLLLDAVSSGQLPQLLAVRGQGATSELRTAKLMAQLRQLEFPVLESDDFAAKSKEKRR